MKNKSIVRFIFLLAISAVFLASAATIQAGALPAGQGRLIVTRSPKLGNNIIVDMMIDGKKAGSLTYGHRFDTTLAAGSHTLSVLPTPRPVYKKRWEMTLNVEAGKTYKFQARSGAGEMVLAK
jgi:ABC-type transport system substrate-binding protein